MIIPKSAFYDDLELDQIPEEAIEGPVTTGVTGAVKAVGNAVAGKNGVLSVADAVLSVKADIGKNSITRMGKDSIQCFPAVFSAAIDTDDAIAIAKMLEKYYASLLVSIYSLRPSVSLKEYNDIAGYIKSIHSNDNVPTNFKKAKHFIGAKEGLEDTSEVAEEGVISDRFMSLANLFDVQVPTSQTMASPLAQADTKKGPANNGGGFLASFFGKKQPKDFKPNLSEAIKCTSKAIEKAKWGIIELDKSHKNLDKKYADAASIIQTGIRLATKDLTDLNEGYQALLAMKAIGSKADMTGNMSYSANFNVIFNNEQLRNFNTAMERFVEHYRNEASHHIFNNNNDKFAIATVGTATEGVKELGEGLKKAGNLVLDKIAENFGSFERIVIGQSRSGKTKVYITDVTLAGAKKWTHEALSLTEKALKKLGDMEKEYKDKNQMVYNMLHACYVDCESALTGLHYGLEYLNGIKIRGDKEERFMPNSATVYYTKFSVDGLKKLLDDNFKDIEKRLKTILTPSVEAFIEDDEFCLVADDPSGLCIDADIYAGTDPDLAYEGLGVTMGALKMDSVNDISLPFKRTQHLLQERLNMRKASEAIGDQANFSSVAVVAGNNSNALTGEFKKESFGAGNLGPVGRPRTNNEMLEHIPTMIEAVFYLHGSGKSEASFTQRVNLGVKCMVRQESSDMIINNLIEGSKSSNPIFRFVSWTRGEYGLVKDLMFNVSEVKKKFKNKKLNESSLLNMSKDRKAIDDISKFAGNRLLPYMTLIVTEYEVLQAAQITGVDLTNPRNAKAFMDDYYLLGFGIYNSGTKKLSVMYDGDSSFETLSMTYIQSQQKSTMNINKDFANLISMR